MVKSVGILIPRPCLLENTAHMTGGKKKAKKKLGSAVLWLLVFPGGKQSKLSVHCTGIRKLSHLISSNLI